MKNVVVVVLACLALAACKPSGTYHLPVQTIVWQSDGAGSIQFYTNDTANLNTARIGWYNSTLVAAPPWTVSATIQKKSGAVEYAAGVVFSLLDGNNYYVLQLAGTGQYRIDKEVAGTYSQVRGWTSSGNIHNGAGATNIVRIDATATNNYAISINGSAETPFNDSDLAQSGKAGFYAAVGTSAYEDFPDTPVDVRFKMTQPVAIP